MQVLMSAYTVPVQILVCAGTSAYRYWCVQAHMHTGTGVAGTYAYSVCAYSVAVQPVRHQSTHVHCPQSTKVYTV